MAPQRGSIHCDRLTAIPDFVSKKRRTIQHPRTLGTIVNRVDVVPTLQDPSKTANCTHQSPDEQEGKFENIHVSNSIHIESSRSTTSTVKRTRGPISKSACKPPNGKKWKCMFIHRQPVGEEASKLAEVVGLYARNDNYFQPYKEWRE
ncbi:hypothetical protein Taro_019855 [Colocasia esculenta]|uniref:Uncharacterized protein n=1 Tax=Colocasia esculenta TaxID=4460 RepID=A0A843UXD0_COLES|nr:hypothetical protein [Colocasia esculenta]